MYNVSNRLVGQSVEQSESKQKNTLLRYTPYPKLPLPASTIINQTQNLMENTQDDNLNTHIFNEIDIQMSTDVQDNENENSELNQIPKEINKLKSEDQEIYDKINKLIIKNNKLLTRNDELMKQKLDSDLYCNAMYNSLLTQKIMNKELNQRVSDLENKNKKLNKKLKEQSLQKNSLLINEYTLIPNDFNVQNPFLTNSNHITQFIDLDSEEGIIEEKSVEDSSGNSNVINPLVNSKENMWLNELFQLIDDQGQDEVEEKKDELIAPIVINIREKKTCAIADS